MNTMNKKQSVFYVARYLLLPIMILGVAIILSRCGTSGQPLPPYKGAVLVGAANVNFDASTKKLTVENFNPPNITPATGGAGPTVSIQSVPAATWYTGTTVAGWVYIANAVANPALTGVMAVAHSGPGTATVNIPNYGNGFRANNPNQGPWSWWFYTGTTFATINIPAGGTSKADLWSITNSSAGNYSFTVYIYAWCPSGVVVNRTNNVNTPVANAFVMLGTSPGDPNYFAEQNQAGTVVNYLPATDANGYFALPITQVTGNYITYTVGGTTGQTAAGATYANFTLYGTALSNVELPVRQRILASTYWAIGTSAGAANVTGPAGLLGAACQNTVMQLAAFLPAMGFEDLINLSLASILGPGRPLAIYGGTGCTANDLTTSLAMPSNLIVPSQNDNNLTVYTAAGGSTSGIAMDTIRTTTLGKDFDIAVPAGVSGISIGGIFGQIPNSALTSLTAGLFSGDPAGLMGVLAQVTWLSYGWSAGLGPYTVNVNPIPAAADNISRTTTAYTLSMSFATINGTLNDPAQTFNVIAVPGLIMTKNASLQESLTTMSLAVGTTAAPPPNFKYLPGTDAAFPPGGLVLPAAFLVDLNSVNANFSASTILADRTGYSTLPGTLNVPFTAWYKLIDLDWSQINPSDQTSVWTSAANGVLLTAPTIAYEAINYGAPVAYTDLYGTAQKQNVNALQWELLMSAAVTGTIIPTLPAYSPGLLLTQPTNSRLYTVNILQGRARTGVNNPVYVWDSDTNIANVMENDFLGATDAFSLTKFHVGGGWIIAPANGANLLNVATYAARAAINTYNWSIVSQGTPANLRGCFTVVGNQSGGTRVVQTNCTGATACASLPAVVIASPYATVSTTIQLSTGVYNAITFTPYNTTAAASVGGGPACQQVGDSTNVTIAQ